MTFKYPKLDKAQAMEWYGKMVAKAFAGEPLFWLGGGPGSMYVNLSYMSKLGLLKSWSVCGIDYIMPMVAWSQLSKSAQKKIEKVFADAQPDSDRADKLMDSHDREVSDEGEYLSQRVLARVYKQTKVLYRGVLKRELAADLKVYEGNE